MKKIKTREEDKQFIRNIIWPHSVLSTTYILLSPFFMQFNGGFVCFVVVGLLLASGTKVMSKSIALESMTLPYQALACPPITTIYLASWLALY